MNIGHNATACLLKDGKIVGCVSEERFSRIKNYWGIPYRSIDYLLKSEGISSGDIDLFVFDNEYNVKSSVEGNPNMEDILFDNYTHNSFFKRVKASIGYKFPAIPKIYANLLGFNVENNKDRIRNINDFSNLLKISPSKIKVIDHHLAHAFSNYANILKNKETLIFTLDGGGGTLCGSIYYLKNNKLRRLSKISRESSLGGLYAITTTFLGMKPLQHEFKVMGLAPYAKKDKVDKVYEKLRELFVINEKLEITSKFSMRFFDVFFQKELKFVRFDNIAGGVQKLVEELTCEWIKKAIAKTGIRDIALSGGIFMNVKANQKIAEMPEVKSLFVMPSCGDESNAIGSCFYGYKKYCEEKNITFNLQPLKDLYLGPEYGNDYICELIKRENLSSKYKIKKIGNINREVARLLAKGEIVARCSGKSEWGARALGNRSILSNASDTNTIKILNETIKDRDFWMPFTPSILDKFEKKYVINPKKISAPYMCITFDSTDKAKKDIPAAMHPYDQTLRPQIVTKEYNKDYYEIIEEFSRLTGKGGILNTSFNLHGEPNVLTPEDALHTVENSDLKYLAMGNYLFEKLK